MEFFSSDIRTADEERSDVLTGLGRQIGQYLQRQRAASQYRITTETARNAIITTDENSIILFANNATSRLFGYSSYELRRRIEPVIARQHTQDGSTPAESRSRRS